MKQKKNKASSKTVTIKSSKDTSKTSRATIWMMMSAIFTFVCIICIVASIILLFHIRFNKAKDIPSYDTSGIQFSYFINRPDALASAKALLVYDADQGVSLLSKNENVRFSPASTAKIMASLVALEHYNLDDKLEYSNVLARTDDSKMGLFLNERMSVRNLIYGMMLPSGNDAAQLIAKNYPGGSEAFVMRMNEKAKELGLFSTFFADPAGYKDENYSTAYDLARLGSVALSDPFLSEVVKTKSTVVYDESGLIPHNLENLNELLEIPGVNGVKTGFTNEAEGVLVTSFSFDSKQYVIVVLRSKDRFADTKELINGIILDLKSERIAF